MDKKEERGLNVQNPPKRPSDSKPLREGQTVTPPPSKPAPKRDK